MRKICRSSNTAAMASLISPALVRSWPIGFSMTSRAKGPLSTGPMNRARASCCTVGTNSDKTGYSLATAPPTANDVRDAVWNALPSATYTDGSFGDRIPVSDSNQREVKITGSAHIAADVHEFQTDVLTDAAIAASAVTKLQSGLATAANLLIVSDRVSYSLAVLVGVCANAQTAAETYTLSIGGNTFTVDYSGLDSSGNRSTTTLSKV